MQDDDIVDTTEMYLKAVLELEEEGVPALRARLADRFDHTPPTVSQTVERLAREGLVDLEADRRLALTARGRATAAAVMRKHRIAEVFLDRVVGLDWEHLHEEACRWEHVMSDRVEVLLHDLLDAPARSPYGNPIAPGRPGAAEPSNAGSPMNLVRVATSATGPVQAELAWIGEPLQADPQALAGLSRSGIRPGSRLRAENHGPTVIVELDGDQRVELPHRLAAHLFVIAA